jgi:hypothetical protein
MTEDLALFFGAFCLGVSVGMWMGMKFWEYFGRDEDNK